MKKMVIVLFIVAFAVMAVGAMAQSTWWNENTGRFESSYSDTGIVLQNENAVDVDGNPYPTYILDFNMVGDDNGGGTIKYTYSIYAESANPGDANLLGITSVRLQMEDNAVIGGLSGFDLPTGWNIQYNNGVYIIVAPAGVAPAGQDIFDVEFSFYSTVGPGAALDPTVSTGIFSVRDRATDNIFDQVQAYGSAFGPTSDVPVAPEPGTLALAATGLVSLVGLRKQIRRG